MNSSSTLVFKQPVNLSQLFNQFNDTTENQSNKDPDNNVKYRYYAIEKIQIENSKYKQVLIYVSHQSMLSQQEF